jgi:NAD(P)H dehydrogenase (quinone)
MSEPRVSIIYYSATGTIHAMAERLRVAALKAGAQVRQRQVEELVPAATIAINPMWQRHVAQTADEPRATADDVVWADVILFGTPTRYGNVASQLKHFLDSLGPQWAQGQLADKVYVGFTAAQTDHGGQESTLLALYNTIHHFGGIIASPGYTDTNKFVDGNPYGVSHSTGPTNDEPLTDVEHAALDHLAIRAITISAHLKAGAAADLRRAQGD